MPKPHIVIYHTHFGLDFGDYIECECGQPAVDIQHIVPRSHFGKKTKHLQDHPDYLAWLNRVNKQAAGQPLIMTKLSRNIIEE